MKIHVHIERLILDGLPVDRHSAPRIQDAVEAELTRLFANSGASPSLLSTGAIPSLRSPPVHIADQSPPDTVGFSVAKAVHGGLQS